MNSSTTNASFSNVTTWQLSQQNLELYIWAGITLPIIYLAASGNLLTLLVIVRSRWWKSGIQVLILSMTIADLSATLIIAPEQTINMLFEKSYPWSYQPFCRAIGYLQMGVSFLVPLHCCMIAVNRLVSIVLPRSFPMNREFREAYQEVLRRGRCGWKPKVGPSVRPSGRTGEANIEANTTKRRSLRPSTRTSVESNV
ncbi:hypothetical protein RvY_04390 [Ramazzottius varieornatus]|uniref:G-protein coupled receptors family 1 profile domain-containing protein n=1 Tax=Ramazzottius varieornatus TaxID=947166 RepID=A0A1D1UUV1_RAMVA|nr:hypothetical protein RvY_04390 [Ramazzottius varieornatus]